MNNTNKNTPAEIKGWNWGAFMFNWFWGVGNKTYLPLLVLIPIFNLFWVFVVGFKGNEWAWQSGNYDDIKTFKAVQATWNFAGLVYFIVVASIFTLYFLLFIGLIGVFHQ
ncbi:ribonuclease G [Weissella muntiaci]|uniref:Ribonuclease G n=1 Tax=Weissella muntiaci TaxID=2508881 RepID=A0A6C2C7E6_9LACO|nr:ribonuclease G [Weissella muntiaci]TYC49878.1 ribonuclease G [Weissella muntiaci]